MGKMYGQSPARDYLGIEETWMILQVDLACSAAVWEDENYKYSEAHKQAQNEASLIGNALEDVKKEYENR